MSWLSTGWSWYTVNDAEVNPIVAGLGGAALVWAAIHQARTATRQAKIANLQADVASRRHEAQTNAELQRRLTENYSKAVDQLANDKIEVRIGGIYALERISRESLDDHWTVMETLTAFIRERRRWQELVGPQRDTVAQFYADTQPETASLPTDIKAALTVITRRSEAGRQREEAEALGLDLSRCDLRGAIFQHTHLNRANFSYSRLDDAWFNSARLNDAWFQGAHLEGSLFNGAELRRAKFFGAHLRSSSFVAAHLEGAYFRGDPRHRDAYIENVDLSRAFGDDETELPHSVQRPDTWVAERG